MRSPLRCLALVAPLLSLLPSTSAVRMIQSKSLNPCQDNSNFTATKFEVLFTPDNRTLAFDVVGVSSISGNVTAELHVIAYGYTALKQTLDPCTMDLGGLCPMSTGQINIESNIQVGQDVVNKIPAIAYGIPDLDGLVRIYINDTDARTTIACVEARLSNGKTVNQAAVAWTTAVIAGMGLVASGVTSGMGHSNTAAHVAANALSLFGFFQAQAFVGMTSVKLPPIVQSWTQNFQWSMGIIRVGFLQDIATWYQRSTGGTPSTLLSVLKTTSVIVQKRSLDLASRGLEMTRDHFLGKRTNTNSEVAESAKMVVVRGIDRVGFLARVERTNIFLTGTIFFILFCFFIGIFIAMFKGFCEVAVKNGWMKPDKFQDFRNGWKVVLKGILFRLVLIGFPQMCVLCLWELTQRDSAAEVILAIVIFLSLVGTLAWASFKVIKLAKRSVDMHKNPAYMLYSDPKCLNKWGFLYVQYRATAYYFVIPVLIYVLVKAIFIAFAQKAPVVQAVALIIIEACFLIGVCVLRPWMDKKTNIFNIAIASINFLNVIFLIFFAEVFGQPGLVTGVMSVVFFVLNAVFALILLVLVLIASIYAIASKNPDTRYQPMRDDRGSFIKSNPQLTTELDALGATARGDVKGPYSKSRLDGDDDSFTSSSVGRQHDSSGTPIPPGDSAYQNRALEKDTVADSQPMYPADSSNRQGQSSPYDQRGMYSQQNDAYSPGYGRSPQSSPLSYGRGGHSSGYGRPAYQNPQPSNYRQQNDSSPWQRGAGYER